LYTWQIHRQHFVQGAAGAALQSRLKNSLKQHFNENFEVQKFIERQ